MTIRFEEKVSIENAQFVCQWSNSLGKSFQEQWMGTMIPFPLTIQVLQDLEGIFSIFDGKSATTVRSQCLRCSPFDEESIALYA